MVHVLNKLGDKRVRRWISLFYLFLCAPIIGFFSATSDRDRRLYWAGIGAMALTAIACLFTIFASGALKDEKKP